MIRRVLLSMVILLLLGGPAIAQAENSHFGRCEVDDDLTAGESLPRLAEVLEAGMPVRVVILGSTSSMGRGASAPDKSYARQLAAAIVAALPGRRVTVVERTGEKRTALMMRDRIAADVVPLAPALVIWETGTTDAIKHLDPTDFGEALDGGLSVLHEAGVDVLLVGPMFNPNAPSIINYDRFVGIMSQVAGAHGVAVFRRGAAMRQLVENGNLSLVPGGDRAATARAVDGLNACIARLLAVMIARSVTPN